ncbi:MAG TPA: protein translocase subunit SecD, partial [Opitutaceae bacterium]|nr:protein translocase subunit SecD [Opitutaceae bacterium]
MIKRNLWKIVISFAILAWAGFTLFPIKDRPFPEYAKSAATAKTAEFAKLVDEASARAAQSTPPQTTFVALKQLAKERRLDLAQLYFPRVNLGDVRNLDRRNNLLLDELLRRSKSKLQLGLDLAGGVAFTLEVDERALAEVPSDQRQEKLSKAVQILGERIDGLGLTEPIIRAIGDNRVEVQLPSVSTKDNPEVVDSVKKPARLDFRLVHPTAMPGRSPEIPVGYEVMTLSNEGRNGDIQSYDLFVKRIPEMTGEGIANSYPVMDEYGRYKIILRFTEEGRGRFAAVTRTIAENNQRTGQPGQLAIVLDGKLASAPSVREEINSDSAEISGSFSQREANDLANVLNNPLDLPLQIKEQYEVGPSLAQDAISSGIRASVIGSAAVAAFMITFYATGGLVAVFSLAVNLLIILGVMASFGATMTLPGLAGIVLTIGMAVDANILIFERMREEMAVGKTLATANHSGFIKALTTIMDAHLVQLIICAIMIWLGTGPIKGFGVTLAIGVVSTLFSVLITGHLVMELLTETGRLKKIRMRRMLGDLKVDFVKYGKPAFISSWIVVLLGVAVVVYKGDRIYGIDFAGGDLVSVQFSQKPDNA